MDVEYRCFVGGLAWATDDHALEKAFSQFGDVLESKIINDRETGRSRGFGFVTFGSEQSMKDAIEGMNGQDLDGRNITVNEAQSRGSGGGRGGGGFRSGSGGGYVGGRLEGGGGFSRGGGGYGGGGGEYGAGGGGGGYGGRGGGGYGGGGYGGGDGIKAGNSELGGCRGYCGSKIGHCSPGRGSDRSAGGARSDRRKNLPVGDDKWKKGPGPFPSRDQRADVGYGNTMGGFRPGSGGNSDVLRYPRGQVPGHHPGGILSRPLQPLNTSSQRDNADADRWQRGTNFQKGLRPSPQTPAQMMHKAEKKYERGKVADEGQAKQRQLKGILNKLTMQ
ncbi:unnamed protein product [Rhodiola kirilowii]